MSGLYPMFVNLSGRSCFVIGGGEVAARKISPLLACGGRVTVICPEAAEPIRRWSEEGAVEWLQGVYGGAGPGEAVSDNVDDKSDPQNERESGYPGNVPVYGKEILCGAFIVIAATDRSDVNKRIAADAAELGIMADIADAAGLSDFVTPAVIRKGRLTIAVSTSGASPTVSKEICRKLEETFGEEYAVYLDMLAELRSIVQSKVADASLRHRMLRAMAGWDLLGHIRQGNETGELWELLRRRLAEAPTWETVAGLSLELERWRK
jgi:precorrin-2 dehydrogenase/sirohydrochlorin ferrochelatase